MIPLETLPPFFANKLTIEEYDAISSINTKFRSSDFSDRYVPKLKWFKKDLVGTNRILNVGCGPGREAFALFQNLSVKDVLGIDVDHEKIRKANELVEQVLQFQSLLPKLQKSIQMHKPMQWPWLQEPDQTKYVRERQEYSEQLDGWFQKFPKWLTEGNVPSFYQQDICEKMPWPDNSFDIVYGRFVLHFLEDTNLHAAAQNMARIIKPETGRVIVIEPTRKDGKPRDYVEPYFQDAGLILIKSETDIERLGGPDCADPNPQEYVLYPKGYIYKKTTQG